MERIAVDFDGTLCRENWPGVGKQTLIHKIVLWYVKRKQKQGVKIILNTLRTRQDRLNTALEWLKEKGFEPDFVNENDPELIERYGDSRKIAATLHIDDRNIGLIGWILRKA